MSLRPVEEHQQNLPPPTHNAGLYSGKSFQGDWGNIPVVPTTTYMIHNNLASANPPPGATTQYPGTNRSSNNIINMPGVYWYSPDNCNYKVKVTLDTSAKYNKCRPTTTTMTN